MTPRASPDDSTFHASTRSSRRPPTIWAAPIDRKLAVTISETPPRFVPYACCHASTKFASDPRAP